MKISIKTLAIYLALSVILNGCSVYFRKESTFNEAYLSKKPVKLITKEDRKVKLKRILYKDSNYYGVYYDNGKKIEFPMSQEKYKSLRIKDRTTTTIINVGGTLLTLGVATLIVYSIVLDDLGNFDFGPTGNNQFKN